MNENGADLELLLRRIIREECGLSAVVPADKWIGGDLVLKPGREGLQDKTIPIETFFSKIVMLRNRLRSLEQHVNASDLPTETKIKLQAYLTGEMAKLEEQKLLRKPKSVVVGDDGLMYVPDYGWSRVQIYQKEAYRLGPDQIAAPQRSPTMFTQ